MQCGDCMDTCFASLVCTVEDTHRFLQAWCILSALPGLISESGAGHAVCSMHAKALWQCHSPSGFRNLERPVACPAGRRQRRPTGRQQSGPGSRRRRAARLPSRRSQPRRPRRTAAAPAAPQRRQHRQPRRRRLGKGRRSQVLNSPSPMHGCSCYAVIAVSASVPNCMFMTSDPP